MVATADRRRGARTGRLAPALLVAALTALAPLVAACETKAQFAPSLPPAAGFRVDDGVLKFWTGTPCEGVTRLVMTFQAGSGDGTQEWTAPRPGVRLERLDLVSTGDGSSSGTSTGTTAAVPGDAAASAAAGDGLQVSRPLPAGYDWTKAGSINFYLNGPATAWGAGVDVARVLRESPQHPADSFLFGERGWMDAATVQRENGRSFITVCTPDPKKST
jgi:hypothetical protein